MNNIRQGFSIGIERIGEQVVLSIIARGHLTHEDYQFMTPLFETALAQFNGKSIKVLADVRDLSGWELHAAWDDFKLGLKHSHDFSDMAIVGQQKWMQYSTQIAAWFLSGEIKYFEQGDEALQWLQG